MSNVILVDLHDDEIGTLEKLEAHQSPKLHRAFSIFLINGSKMLIQKRAKNKYHSAGLWANSCCSHPTNSNIFLDAQTRLKEELGIFEPPHLEELFSFVYFHQFAQNLFEFELDHVLIGVYSGPISPNPDEAETCKWVEFEEVLADLAKSPQEFAPWFVISAPTVIKKISTKEE